MKTRIELPQFDAGVWLESLHVTRDRRAGAPESMPLGFMVLSARRPVGRPPVMFLCGGPGDSPLDYLENPRLATVLWEAEEEADLILPCQRGTRGSSLHEVLPAWAGPPPQSPEEAMDGLTRQMSEVSAPAGCLTAADSADDLDILLDHVMERRVDLWAHSYGTHLAMTFMSRHPKRVRRAVFGGFEGPNQTWKLPSRTRAAAMRLADHLRETGQEEDLMGLLNQTVDRLSAAPVGGLSAFTFRWMLASWIGLSVRWKPMLETCRAVLAMDEAALQKPTAGFLKSLEKPVAFYAKDLASGATEAKLREIRSEADDPLFGMMNFPFPEVREALPTSFDLGDGHRDDPVLNHEILCLTGSLDAFTPPENVAEQGEGLRRMRHEDLPGLAHNDLLTHAETTRRRDEFFR
ncbi:MAG: alpha/beta hydrolase [Fimbriimonadaceae bacterium]|nr:alpha/beta hydrolase [Fimbriimonadaceae bacterium]